MHLLYKLLRQEPGSRDGVVAATSVLGIIVNVLIAALKVAIGVFASSIAILSSGVNNATDALTSVLTLVGTKLSAKRPDAKHPFGYGRIEYLTSLVIAGLILFSGFEMLIGSVELIFEPAEMRISHLMLVIIAVTAVIKYFMGVYMIRTGRKVDSGALVAVGLEGRNDAFVSLVTLFSAGVFLLFGWDIDAYAGVFTSVIILKAGFDVLRETVSALLGKPGQEELARQLYKELRAEPLVVNAADMMLHNYGPESYSGSVNLEISHEKTVGEVYQRLHQLQLRIMHEYKVTMVFGIYAVDNDHERIRQLRQEVAAFIQTQEHVCSFHALYIEPGTERIYCDFVVDYQLKDWDGLERQFKAYLAERYPNSQVELTVETEFV